MVAKIKHSVKELEDKVKEISQKEEQKKKKRRDLIGYKNTRTLIRA